MSKWLLRKASGARARHKLKGDFSDVRHVAKTFDHEDLPQHTAMGKAAKTYLDTSLVGRWLHSKVGTDFDTVYSEFLTRIQPKYLDDYRECIFWYVQQKEYITIAPDGEVWTKREGNPVPLKHNGRQSEFYVDPETNLLMRLEPDTGTTL